VHALCCSFSVRTSAPSRARNWVARGVLDTACTNSVVQHVSVLGGAYLRQVAHETHDGFHYLAERASRRMSTRPVSARIRHVLQLPVWQRIR
jgi:hypothetical protein